MTTNPVIVALIQVPVMKVFRRTDDFSEMIAHVAVTSDGTLWGLVRRLTEFPIAATAPTASSLRGRTVYREDLNRFVRIKGLPFCEDEIIDWEAPMVDERTGQKDGNP